MRGLSNNRKKNPGKHAPPLLYWKYVAHDTTATASAWRGAHSQSDEDFLSPPAGASRSSESVPFLTLQPNRALTLLAPWSLIARPAITGSKKGRTGSAPACGRMVSTMLGPNYSFYVAHPATTPRDILRDVWGRLRFGERTVGAHMQRDWFRPNPPLPRVRWSSEQHHGTVRASIRNEPGPTSRALPQHFYIKSTRAISRPDEGPAAWVVPGDTTRVRSRPPTW